MITCLALSPSLDVTYLVDTLEPGSIARPREKVTVAGGKGLNVARVVARLGEPVRAIAVLGGFTGGRIAALLEGSGVDLEILPTESETRTCISVSPGDDDRLTELYEPSSAFPADAWPVVERSLASLAEGDWLVLSGSLPPGCDPRSVASALHAARNAGVLVAVDTHGAALEAVLGARPHVVKVNRSEAAGVLSLPESTPLAELAELLRRRTSGTIVLTDGANGSIAVDHTDVIRMPPAQAMGRYPVGSGDSFFAGLVVALSRRARLGEAMRLAAACAEANATVPGAAVWSVDALDPTLTARS